MPSRAALVFPGQGAFDKSRFRSGTLHEELEYVLASIASSPLESQAAVTARRLAESLREQVPTTPAAMSLFVFAASVANFVALEEWGVRPADTRTAAPGICCGSPPRTRPSPCWRSCYGGGRMSRPNC